MAITLSSLTEEMLTKQERAVVRNVYRVGQLAEALVSLDKSLMLLDLQKSGSLDPTIRKNQEHVDSLQKYLKSAMLNTLINTKVPGIIVRVPSTLPNSAE